MDLFKAEELMAMVVGNEDYDWGELEGSTQYKEGYAADHPTIVNFWSVFQFKGEFAPLHQGHFS